jgi:hypothetical protein
MQWIKDDGGREAAGMSGRAGDCVCRAVAIAAELPYDKVWSYLAERNAGQRASCRSAKRRETADDGITVKRKWFKDYMKSLGFRWVSTMGVGTGCHVHLRKDELPPGRLVCRLSRHVVAVIDGVIHDTYDPSRGGTRCVYGYWMKGPYR